MMVSRHARKRMRQRLGLNAQGVERELERALRGVTIDETSGRLRRWLDQMRHFHGETAWYRLTGQALYAFHGEVLVTVFLIPPAHVRAARRVWKAHAEDADGEGSS